jgi:hypothetical protein
VEGDPEPGHLQRRAVAGLRARAERRATPRSSCARTRAGATETRASPSASRRPASGRRASPSRATTAGPRTRSTPRPRTRGRRAATAGRSPTKVGVIELATGTQAGSSTACGASASRATARTSSRSSSCRPTHRPEAARRRAARRRARPHAPSGSVLMLVDLAGGTPVTLAGVGEYAFDAAGPVPRLHPRPARPARQRRAAARARHRAWCARSTPRRRSIGRLTWADTGDALAVLRSVADSATKRHAHHGARLGAPRLAHPDRGDDQRAQRRRDAAAWS